MEIVAAVLLLTLLALTTVTGPTVSGPAGCCCAAATYNCGSDIACQVPLTLHFTVTNVSGCACVDGATGTLLLNPPADATHWRGGNEDVGRSCSHELFDNLINDCTSDGAGHLYWRMTAGQILAFNGSDNAGVTTVCQMCLVLDSGVLAADLVCAPFSFSITKSVRACGGLFADCGCVGGSIKFSFTA